MGTRNLKNTPRHLQYLLYQTWEYKSNPYNVYHKRYQTGWDRKLYAFLCLMFFGAAVATHGIGKTLLGAVVGLVAWGVGLLLSMLAMFVWDDVIPDLVDWFDVL
jgi:hypothetical protein